MSLFERIQKKIIIESSSDTTGQNKKNKKKKFSSNISRTVKVSKDTEGLASRQGRLDATDPKQGGYSRVDDTIDNPEYKKAKTMGTPTKTIGSMKTYNVNKKNRPLRKGVDYFFDAEKAKKEREAFQQGRKAYTDSRSGIKAGKVTDKGVIDYITKARNMNQGTNANTKANRKAAEIIAKSSGAEYKEKIRQKYETDKDLPRRRGKNMPSYDEIKKEIDSRPPDGRTTRNKPKLIQTKPKLIQTKVTDKEIQDLIKKGQQSTPKPGKIAFGARDKAIKDLDDLIIQPKKGDVAKTKKLISKEVKRKTTPKPDEIKIQKNIIKQGPKATPFVTSDKKSIDDFIKAKDPFNVKGEKPKGSSTGGGRGPNQNPEYQRLLNQQRRNNQAFDAFDDSDAGRPGTGNTIDNTTTRNRTTSKPETKPKSSKKIGGKSFEDLMKDNKRKLEQLKNKKLVQSSPIKTGSRVTTGNQIPFVNPPLKTPPITQPLKEPRKIKKILSTKTPAYNPYKSTSRFKKVMTALKKNPKTALAAAAIGTGVYLYNRGKNNPKGIVPPPSNKGKIRGAKGVDIKFTLGGGDPSKGFKYAGRKDTNK